jgi:hypothetical protein
MAETEEGIHHPEKTEEQVEATKEMFSPKEAYEKEHGKEGTDAETT